MYLKPYELSWNGQCRSPAYLSELCELINFYVIQRLYAHFIEHTVHA